MSEFNENKYMIGIKTKELNFKYLAGLAVIINQINLESQPLALDLQEVETVTEDFFTFIKNFSETTTLSLVNISAEIFAILNLRRYDKNVRIYNTELDYLQNRNELINRQLHLVK